MRYDYLYKTFFITAHAWKIPKFLSHTLIVSCLGQRIWKLMSNITKFQKVSSDSMCCFLKVACNAAYILLTSLSRKKIFLQYKQQKYTKKIFFNVIADKI